MSKNVGSSEEQFFVVKIGTSIDLVVVRSYFMHRFEV
jgi:hypothetical protein